MPRTGNEFEIKCAFTKMVNVSELKPHPKNPNTHPERQIELLIKIIKETGWRSPVVVSNLSGFIIKGHGRYLAAKQAGFKKIPVDFQDYTSTAQELADMVADNTIAELSEINEGALFDIFEEVDNREFEIFKLEEFDNIFDATKKQFTQDDALQIEVDVKSEDEFLNVFNSESNPELPIIPRFSEHHTAFIIICDNRIDETFIREKLGITKVRKNGKDKKLYIPNIITAKEVLEKWK